MSHLPHTHLSPPSGSPIVQESKIAIVDGIPYLYDDAIETNQQVSEVSITSPKTTETENADGPPDDDGPELMPSESKRTAMMRFGIARKSRSPKRNEEVGEARKKFVPAISVGREFFCI